MPSATSFGRTISAISEHVVGDLGRLDLAAGVDVAAHVALRADAAKRGVLAVVHERDCRSSGTAACRPPSAAGRYSWAIT